MSTQTVQGRAPRERGLGYALAGGAAVTLVAILIGGLLFTWLLLANRGPSAPELLPADTQLYGALSPNVAGTLELDQLRRALREGLGVSEPDALVAPIERRLGVTVRDDVITWLGSEMAVAVRGADPAALQGADAAAALLRDGELLLFFGSKNDPQAKRFIEKHRAARMAQGDQIVDLQRADVTIYAQTNGPPSPITAFALIDHYVVFSNSQAALEALAAAEPGQAGRLAEVPAFATFTEELTPRRPGAIYTDGSAAAEAARAALRELLNGL